MAGVNFSCVYRRPSGIYVVRLVVPFRLRPQLKKSEIHVSTGCRDHNAAKLAALQIQAEWRSRFMELDIARLSTASPLLAGDGFISVTDAATAIGMPLSAFFTELGTDGVDFWVAAGAWAGWKVDDYLEIDQEDNGGFVLNDVEAQGQRTELTGFVRAFHRSAVFSQLQQTGGTASASVFRQSGRAVFFSDTEQSIAIGSWFVQKSSVERIRSRLAGYVLPNDLKAAKVASSTLPSLPSGLESLPFIKYQNRRFSELFQQYRSHQQWTDDHSRRMTTEAEMFIELMNDPCIGDIDVQLIHEYAELLKRLPSNTYQARRKRHDISLSELIEIAERESQQRKEQKTVNDHIARLGQVFNYGVSPGGWMNVNPADKFKRAWNKVNAMRDQDQRDEFTSDELKVIFSHPNLRSGGSNWRPHYYWLPLLATTTGGRLNELSQLYLDDLRQSEDKAVWYVDFNLDQPDKKEIDQDWMEGDKSLKTVNSIRVVPLHPVLIKAGLLEYVEVLRKAGHSRLFPELRYDKRKGYGKPVGSWFNERFLGRTLGIERDGRKVFHSFRHNFASMIERLDLTERVSAQLTGHQRGKTQSWNRYAKDRDAVALNPLIEQLSFPFLDSMPKFDAKVGIQAIKAAIRRKRAPET